MKPDEPAHAKAGPVDPPFSTRPRSSRGLWVGLAGVAVLAGIIVLVGAGRSTPEPPADAMVPADARVIVEVPARDATIDRGIVLVIGPLGHISDAIRAVIRPRIADLVTKLAPDIRPVLVAEDARAAGKAHRAAYLDADANKLEIRGGNVVCKVSALIASYPEKSVFGFADRAAEAVGVGTTNDTAANCLEAAMTEILNKDVLPMIRANVKIAAP